MPAGDTPPDILPHPTSLANLYMEKADMTHNHRIEGVNNLWDNLGVP